MTNFSLSICVYSCLYIGFAFQWPISDPGCREGGRKGEGDVTWGKGDTGERGNGEGEGGGRWENRRREKKDKRGGRREKRGREKGREKED